MRPIMLSSESFLCRRANWWEYFSSLVFDWVDLPDSKQ